MDIEGVTCGPSHGIRYVSPPKLKFNMACPLPLINHEALIDASWLQYHVSVFVMVLEEKPIYLISSGSSWVGIKSYSIEP